MDIQKNSFLSIEQLADRVYNGRTAKEGKAINGFKNGLTTDGLSFQDFLDDKSQRTDALRFSKHAALRLSDRGIELSEEQLARLEDGAGKAREKGIRDSLVIVDGLAFIVNVPNRTVVTAMDSTQTDENVFTNINGAVIM